MKFQLRDEAPIGKLLESLGVIAEQWGESDPLDMDENLVHEETAFVKSDTISAYLLLIRNMNGGLFIRLPYNHPYPSQNQFYAENPYI